MDLNFAFLADSAVVPPDGKVYALGGGICVIALPELPARASFAVVAGFHFTAADAERSHSVEVRLVDAAGKFVVQPATLQFQAGGPPPGPDDDVNVPTVTYMQPLFAEPGAYAVEFWAQDRLLQAVRLTIRERQAPPALGPRPN